MDGGRWEGGAVPSLQDPAVFVLNKAGKVEPILHIPLRTITISKAGRAVGISLEGNKNSSVDDSEIVVECWTAKGAQAGSGRASYPWRFRLSVPNGGLIQRGNRIVYEAPEAGYIPELEISSSDDPKSWRNGFRGEYYALLGDGCYARFTLQLNTSGDHFVAIESYKNPIPGHRNLEVYPDSP